MKKLKVDVEEVAFLMESQDRYETNYYLDTETGETLAIPGEVLRAHEEGEFPEDLPDWELQLIPQAKEILEGSPRYREIPVRFNHTRPLARRDEWLNKKVMHREHQRPLSHS